MYAFSGQPFYSPHQQILNNYYYQYLKQSYFQTQNPNNGQLSTGSDQNSILSNDSSGEQSEEVADYVIELTNDNFDQLTRYGKWLIEVHAPYCQPCKQLYPTWQKLARELRDEKINVAKINGQQNRFLKQRFGTQLYPSIYMLDRGNAYEYPREGSREFTELKKFAMGGFRTEKSLGWFGAPNSSFGRLYAQFKKLTS